MICALIAVIGGLALGLKTPLISPLIYILRYKRELFLAAFFVYCIILGYEFEISDLYSFDLSSIFTILIPTILILDSGLRCESLKEELKSAVNYAVIPMAVLGLFFKELFIAAVIIFTIYHFSMERPKKGIIIVFIGILILLSGIFGLKNFLNQLGSASTQVTFISAISILIVIFLWKKNVNRRDFLS